MIKNKINIVIGVSSSGKSTFIKEKFGKEKICFANRLKKIEDLPNSNNIVLHINLLRWVNGEKDISKEILNKFRDNIQVFVMIDYKSEILKRILLRTSEQEKLEKIRVYPNRKVFSEVSMFYEFIYQELFQMLIELKIDMKIIHSTCHTNINLAEAENIIKNNNFKVSLTKDDREKMLSYCNFSYTKSKIKDGNIKVNHDLQSRLDFIFNKIISTHCENQLESLIDIGCDSGLFCFEAEKCGFKKIVGTELKEERFLNANILKLVNNSIVNFSTTNIFVDNYKEQFDVVLLLNVIHHLKYPIYSLDKISQICKKCAIIEFPTLSDIKFQDTTTSSLEHGPYIGVSLSVKDQSFVFSKLAIKRIIENYNMFREVKFYESPTNPGRIIAVCIK